MRYILLLFLLIGSITIQKAQEVQVFDSSTKEPLDLVIISNTNEHLFTTTNEFGRADMSAFKSIDSISFYRIGYKTAILDYAEIASNDFSVAMEIDQVELDQVVVSASKWEQTRKEVPARVSTITAEQIAMANPQTAADLLGSSGEVYIQKSQLGGGSPMIRGFSTNRILISIDGIRMNNAIFRAGNLQNVISLDPQTIQSAEVLFGPGSVIYGSDAIGGVMRFTSLKPWLSFDDKTRLSAKILTRYATANQEKTVHGHVKLGWKKWAIVSSISYSDFGDLRMGKNGRDEYLRPFYVESIEMDDVLVVNENPLIQRPTGYNQMNILQKIRFQPNQNVDFTYSFHDSRTSNVPRYDRLLRTRNGLPYSAEWYYGPQKWQMHHLETTFNHQTKLFDKLSIQTAYQHYEESRHDRNFNGEIRSENFEKVDASSLNIDGFKALNDHNKLYYGIEAVLNEVTSSGRDIDIRNGSIRPAAARYPESTWYSLAGYLTYQHKLSDAWIMQTGARYNHIGLRSGFDQTYFPLPFDEATIDRGAVTGSLGFVFAPDNHWIWRSSVSTGFRSPNVDDIGKIFDSEPGAVVVPNPDLKPENAYNFEMSLTYDWSKGCSVFLNGYYTQLQNAMVRRNFTLNGLDSIIYAGELSQVQAIQNAAKANVFGIEVGADIQSGSGLGGKIRYNYQMGEEELDDGSVSPSRHAPPPFGYAALTYQRKNLMAEISGSFNATKTFEQIPQEERSKDYQYATDENGRPWSPGWFIMSIKSSYAITTGLKINVGLENLFDQRYRPYSSGIVAPGRNLIVSVSYEIE